ncbi:Paf1-domain-containing protein [Auricularia subglabra TFB-10046 SS5]|nr:Paf1-domain-containing protein [Auricularia subglabra TFB-10046 SS5]
MSLRKSKLDLLVRVRYSNPLPPPPFPPKLLTIPTSPARYAQPSFTDALAAETPLPMIVDSDLGMPLDLGHWECLWEDKGDLSQLNPSEDQIPEPDPRDLFLLGDILSSLPEDQANGAHPNGGAATKSLPDTPGTPSAPAAVSWLRKTEYLSREPGRQRQFAWIQGNRENDEVVDISREAQIRDIEATFELPDVATLTHPTKPGLTAVAVYDALPDAELWPNAYDLFKFAERPGDGTADARLDSAVLRPMESDGDHFLAYYLTRDDESSEKLKARRRGQLGDPSEAAVDRAPTQFHFVRDYETVKIEQDVPNEFLLVLDDGDLPPAHVGGSVATRPRGAYYKNIERKITLKKKRINKYDVAYTDKWDIITLSNAQMNEDELKERKIALAQVQDPEWWFRETEERVQDVMADIMEGDVDDL